MLPETLSAKEPKRNKQTKTQKYLLFNDLWTELTKPEEQGEVVAADR